MSSVGIFLTPYVAMEGGHCQDGSRHRAIFPATPSRSSPTSCHHHVISLAFVATSSLHPAERRGGRCSIRGRLSSRSSLERGLFITTSPATWRSCHFLLHAWRLSSSILADVVRMHHRNTFIRSEMPFVSDGPLQDGLLKTTSHALPDVVKHLLFLTLSHFTRDTI
uniref:Uncharacterized protein n=1 Tax=Leersia perrieri TaxID=77586 RepID=A0A0D9VW58_9ORYZ